MPNRDIQQLLQLAQVTNTLGQPQQQQQELQQHRQQQMMQTALQLLGLRQQQQEAEANRAATQLFRDQTLAQGQQQADERSGQFWGGELPAKYAGQESAANEAALTRELTAGHYKNIEGNQAADVKNAADRNLISASELYGQPNANPVASEALATHFPELGQSASRAKDAAHSALVQRLLGEVGAIKDPAVRQMHLSAQTAKDPAAMTEILSQLGLTQPQGGAQLQAPVLQNAPAPAVPQLQRGHTDSSIIRFLRMLDPTYHAELQYNQ